MKPNTNELIVGSIVGVLSAIKIGWIAIPVACVTSLLWAMSGAGMSKLYRRLGVPATISLVCALTSNSLFPLISIPLGFAVLSLGYGIPTTQPPDEGSWLGKLAFKWANKNENKAEFYCRTIIYVLLTIAFLPCFLIN